MLKIDTIQIQEFGDIKHVSKSGTVGRKKRMIE
jgi:hypothetical protein